MSESVKPRFAVDLDEIERQLAQAQGAPSQAAPATRNDPLAELARIVGQDDPFQSLLAGDQPARPRNQANAGLDDLFAVREPAAAAPAPRAAQPQTPRGGQAAAPAYHYDQYPQAEARPDQYAYHQAPAQGHDAHDAYDHTAYGQDYYDPNAAHHADSGYDQDADMGYAPVEKPRSRKGLILAGAVLGAVVIGGGGAYLLGGGSSSLSGGEPPLIEASNEPIKVQPQNPGGVEIPNQNKQIYERANTETKVVNREEQPVDVAQAVRMNSGGAGDATGATSAGRPAGGLDLGEPRKVRTVTIRPDGSVVQPGGAAAPRAAGSVLPTMSLPPAAQGNAAPPPPAQVAAAAPQPAPSTPAPAQPAPAPEPVQAAPAPTPAASTPASGSSPQRVASAQPVAVAPAETPPLVTPTGDFSVQLGVSSSESDAQAAFERFQKKYPELEGLPSIIRKAEVNGNTLYRVRVGPMARDEASSLCSRLQGQGGQCFVAKN
ncbi:SPOR domain-containing protein [Microvirga lenta]|uniref:SPOR domain-containing protein n=1 Tax=Microvirga lenta TaxID=2881337 RepID=UPI001CFFF718|nr:SPOR domain-containing protein [Microvirga lenta]MCB5177010.1 SPOR domain-containing protein [Microvirga lenta]